MKAVCLTLIIIFTMTVTVSCLIMPASPNWAVKDALENVDKTFTEEDLKIIEDYKFEYDWFQLVMSNYSYKINSSEIVGNSAFVKVTIKNKNLQEAVVNGTMSYISEAMNKTVQGTNLTTKDLNNIYIKNIEAAVIEVDTIQTEYIFVLELDHNEWVITNKTNELLLNAMTGNLLVGFTELEEILG